MPLEERVRQRIEELLGQVPQLSIRNEFGEVRSEDHRQECAGWLASAFNLIQLLCPSPTDAYRTRIDHIVAHGVHQAASDQVGEVGAILRSLLTDAQGGLLASVADQARAETFDDFLDHADVYAKQNRKQESGVIAGVVFEDALRRGCRKHKVLEKGVSLDQLITDLTNASILSGTKAKRARVAAHVRTKATHAQWDEFDMDDVRASIGFTREFIESVLDR